MRLFDQRTVNLSVSILTHSGCGWVAGAPTGLRKVMHPAWFILFAVADTVCHGPSGRGCKRLGLVNVSQSSGRAYRTFGASSGAGLSAAVISGIGLLCLWCVTAADSAALKCHVERDRLEAIWPAVNSANAFGCQAPVNMRQRHVAMNYPWRIQLEKLFYGQGRLIPAAAPSSTMKSRWTGLPAHCFLTTA